MEFTNENKVFYILGLLGYNEYSYNTAKLLLEDNNYDISKIYHFYYALYNSNYENNSCSIISLAGNYPKVKLKNGNFNDINEIAHKLDINISIE